MFQLVPGKVLNTLFAFIPPLQVTANDADVDRPNNIIYFLTGPGINAENPSESNFDINKATGEIFVLKVRLVLNSLRRSFRVTIFLIISSSEIQYFTFKSLKVPPKTPEGVY